MESNVFTISPVISRGFLWMMVFVSFLCLGLLILLAGIYYSAHKIQFAVNPDGLKVTKAFFYGRTIPTADIITERIQIVNLKKDRQFNPLFRTNGIGMPGFLSGWFRLNNKEKALLFITDKEKVLYIPTIKYSVLISVTEPEQMLRKIKENWRL